MSLASLITMRKAATISGVLLAVAVLEYIVIVHLYIDIQDKQQVAVSGLQGITDAKAPVLEDWGPGVRKVAARNTETAKYTFKGLQKFKQIMNLRKRLLNISDTEPLETEPLETEPVETKPTPRINARGKPLNSVKRDRNALKETHRHPLESDADDTRYRGEESHTTPSTFRDGDKALVGGARLSPSPVANRLAKQPHIDPQQPIYSRRGLWKAVNTFSKHEYEAVPQPSRGKAQLRPSPVAKHLSSQPHATDDKPNRDSAAKLQENTFARGHETTGRAKPLDSPPEDGRGRSETVMRANPIRKFHLRSRNQTDSGQTVPASRVSVKGESRRGWWRPLKAAKTAAGERGGEKAQSEGRKTGEDDLDSLLADYVMEMTKTGEGVKHPPNSRFPIDESEFEIVMTDHGINVVKKKLGPEVLVENDTRPYRTLTKFEEEGGNIMFTLRTTLSYHAGRLPLMFDTWMSETDCSRIFLVTDGYDWVTQAKVRLKEMHYEVTSCGRSYHQLCCKAGMEMELLFKPGNEKYDWLCHIDDDMYVIPKSLVKILSKFNPRKEPVYFGRSGSEWHQPRRVKLDATMSTPGKKYHFAVGGMYCLSRAMLEEAKDYLVGGEAFAESCRKTQEPEDVTVGLVVGAVLNHALSRTEMIYTHGLHLYSIVDPDTIDEQIAFSYGFGSTHWGMDPFNAVYVPDALFTTEEDESQFKSLHCHLYPTVPWCVAKKEQWIKHHNDFHHDYDEY